MRTIQKDLPTLTFALAITIIDLIQPNELYFIEFYLSIRLNYSNVNKNWFKKWLAHPEQKKKQRESEKHGINNNNMILYIAKWPWFGSKRYVDVRLLFDWGARKCDCGRTKTIWMPRFTSMQNERHLIWTIKKINYIILNFKNFNRFQIHLI